LFIYDHNNFCKRTCPASYCCVWFVVTSWSWISPAIYSQLQVSVCDFFVNTVLNSTNSIYLYYFLMDFPWLYQNSASIIHSIWLPNLTHGYNIIFFTYPILTCFINPLSHLFHTQRWRLLKQDLTSITSRRILDTQFK